MIGLTFGNLKKFRQHPRDTHIIIKGEDVGLSIDVLIFSGETEEAMAYELILRGTRPAGSA